MPFLVQLTNVSPDSAGRPQAARPIWVNTRHIQTVEPCEPVSHAPGAHAYIQLCDEESLFVTETPEQVWGKTDMQT